MTSSNGNIFRGTGPLCGEFTGHRWIPITKANDTEIWCFFFICAWIKGWVNKREAGDSRRHRAHYDVTAMFSFRLQSMAVTWRACTKCFPWSCCLRNTFRMTILARMPGPVRVSSVRHDDVIKWKHFRRHWPVVRGIHRRPVKSPHRGQWRGALMFSLIWAWINGWVNSREAGDLRRYCAHYDVTVMIFVHRNLCIENYRLVNRLSKPLWFVKQKQIAALHFRYWYVTDLLVRWCLFKFPIGVIFDFIESWLKSFESSSCYTGVKTAKLWRNLSNRNMIFNR